MTTIFTTKSLTVTITNMLTAIASFGCIRRRNSNQPNALEQALVTHELAKLVKAPLVQLCFLCLTFWLCCFSYPTQILNSDALIFIVCLCYYPFCNSVIVNRNEAPLSPTKPFQEPLGSFCAFGLNRRSDFCVMFSNFFQRFRIEIGAVGQYRNVRLSKINSNKLFSITYLTNRNLNRLVQIKFSTLADKVALPFDVLNILWLVANKWNLNSSRHRPNRSDIALVGKYPTVVCNASGQSKFPLHLFINAVRISNLAYAANNRLRGKTGAILNQMVNFVVQFVLPKHLFIPRKLRNFITRLVALHNGFHQDILLLFRWVQSYLKRQFHYLNLVIQNYKHKTGIWSIPPHSKESGFLDQLS